MIARIRPSLPVALLVLLLTGCGEPGQQNPVDQASATPGRSVPEDAQLVAGRYQYMADAAIFTGCHTGQRWPVAPVEAAIDAERAYLNAHLPAGNSMVITAYGRIEVRPGMEEGTEIPHLVIYRLESAPSDINCPLPEASLNGRRWELAQWLEGQQSQPASPPWIVFGEDGRTHGHDGCNRFNGDYRTMNRSLEMGPLVQTRMACTDGAMATGKRFTDALQRTTRYQQEGDLVTLYAGDQPLIQLEGIALQ